MKEVVHKAASRKGGRIKTDKGLAAMSPEKRREVQSLGGKTNANRSRKGAKQTQEDSGGSTSVLEAVLGDIE